MDTSPAAEPVPSVQPLSLQDGGRALRGWMKGMRDGQPVWRDRYGVFHVFRYETVQRVLVDHETFSSDRSRLMPPNGQLGRGNLTMMDPPEHRAYRALISKAFTPKMVAALESRISQVTDELIGEIATSEFDLVQQLAHPLPVIVIAQLLGVPVSDRGLFRAWSAGFGRGEPLAMLEMTAYLADRVQKVRRAPGSDLISKLTTVESDGQRLDDDEVVSLSGLLLLAGHITTTTLIGNAVLCLDDNPAIARAVHRDPSLIPLVIEEVLRYRPPFTQMGRITTRDTSLEGHPVPRGRLVNAWLLSANHDERAFVAPDVFDIHRSPSRHAAFGHGIHFCLGAPLARLEARIALQAVMKAFPELRVAPDAELSFYDHPTCALKGLPVVS